jgi:hypothetical protein
MQMKRLAALVLMGFACSLYAQTPVNYQHPIPYAPAEYVCYRATQPIQLDGRLEEADWKAVPWTEDFVDIEGVLKPAPAHRTRAKMLWDSTYFYFAAEMIEPHLWATLTERDAVMYQNDDFEIFIDPDGDGQYYYEFEMNAHNAIWDLFLLRPYRVNDGLPKYLNNWDMKGIQSAVYLQGTLNDPSDRDTSWSVEVAIPWSALKEMAPERRGPKVGEQWRVNFSRVDWHFDIREGQYRKKRDSLAGQVVKWPEENWVWSPSGRVDMHQVETWGYVQFAGTEAGAGEELFHARVEEQIKWGLWQLYHQQAAFRRENGYYAAELKWLTLPDLDLPGYRFLPQLWASRNAFQVSVLGQKGGYWHVDQNGRVWHIGN